MENIKIKGFKNGILLEINPDSTFEDIIKELSLKLEKSRKIFGNALTAIKVTGRQLTNSESDLIFDIFHEFTDLTIVTVFTEAPETEQYFLNKILSTDGIEKLMPEVDNNEKITFNKFNPENDLVKTIINDCSDVFVYNKSLKNGEMISSEKDIVIIGDITKGCTVVSEKSIFVIGKISGEVFAGAITKQSKGNRDAIVFCLDLEAEELKISDLTLKSLKKSIFTGKNKYPVICKIGDKGVTIENYHDGILNEK